jgi:alkylresorcinol/alkylpyrone synthase
MRIAGVASAFPRHYFSQEEVAQELKSYWSDQLNNPDVLTRMLTRVGVEGRHFVQPLTDYKALDTWGKNNDAWIANAEELAEQALCKAMTRAGFDLDSLGAIFFVSVTGVCSPSIDARLVNRMKLPRDIKRNPIFGLGCVAGAAGIARAADYVRAFPKDVAAVISVELCSLTWQREDLSVANLISSGLFGDGAAAVVVAGNEVKGNGPQVVATRSSFYPDTEEMMGWKISEKGFNIVLSPAVPDLVQQRLAKDVDEFLADNGLTRANIASWIMHTGGPKILEATESALGLVNGELKPSWECLKKVGNLSSASVLVVLEEHIAKYKPAPGQYSLLAAMGPGFCAELVLLKW